MIRAGDTIENPLTGERIVFQRTSRETDGDAVVLEAFLQPNGLLAAALVDPAQEVRFQVLRGSVGFLIGQKAMVARSGERLTVLPGTPYDVWNAGDEEAHLVCEVRPARAFEERIGALRASEARPQPEGRSWFRSVVAAAAVAVALVAAASASASSIVFVKNHNVWLARADGSGHVRLTRDGNAANPYYSPSQADDGTIVALRGRDGRPFVATYRGGGSKLYRLSRTGRVLGKPRVTLFDPLPSLVPRATHAEVSPNGRLVAITQLLYRPVGTGPARRLELMETQNVVFQDTASGKFRGKSELVLQKLWSPSWIDNGTILAFDQYAQAAPHVYWARVGQKPRALYRDPADSDKVPGWNGATLGGGELTRRGDKLAAVRANRAGGQRTIELFAARGVSAPPTPRCTIKGRRISLEPGLSWSTDGASLAWWEPSGIWTSRVNLAAPNCGFAPRLVIRGGMSPDWGPR